MKEEQWLEERERKGGGGFLPSLLFGCGSGNCELAEGPRQEKKKKKAPSIPPQLKRKATGDFEGEGS